MSNTPFPFDEHPEQASNGEDALSAEDWAVIHAFDALDSWETPSETTPLEEQTAHTRSETNDASNEIDEMLITFATEVEEEIESMHHALQRIEHAETVEVAHLLPLERAGHKLRGAAGSMECYAMATLAGHIEDLTKLVMYGQATATVVIPVLLQAVLALQTTLVHLLETGQESTVSLQELEEEIQRRSLDTVDEEMLEEDDLSLPIHIDVRSSDAQPLSTGSAFFRVDVFRIEELVRHSEQLAELHTPLESTQAQTEAALEELQRTQQRLQHIESQFLTLFTQPQMVSATSDVLSDSSLIARILTEGLPGPQGMTAIHTPYTPHATHALHTPHTSHIRKSKHYPKIDEATSAPQWDELEMEHYTERDELLRAFSEAMMDVAIATNAVRSAYTQLSVLLQKYKEQVTTTRNDILRLRSAPLSVLLPRLERAIHMSVAGQEQKIHFEVTGEAIEVDQDILEALSIPLLQLLRTCISDIAMNQTVVEQEQSPYRVRLRAQSIGNELLLEIGFSMQVQGGIIDAIREPIDRLKGTISLQRNEMNGVSFHIRLPRSQGAVRCLFIRVDDQQLIVPFSQIHRIEDAREASVDTLYTLKTLLGLSADSAQPVGDVADRFPSSSIQPMIVPLQEPLRPVAGIIVDEVLDECEVLVKPLPAYMQRPGIIGSTIDGKGQVLLMLDLPTLIHHYTMRQRTQTTTGKPTPSSMPQHKPSILIADDSTSIRQSLQHTLSQKNYTLYEARDGMEALEQLTEHPPDIFLLDMEMPNLNGYDLLSIMRLYPELSDVKVIILTSRSSHKHRQRALAMGARAYLTKPCPQDVLLQTIEQLLVE